MLRIQLRTLCLIAAPWLLAAACETQSNERTREVVDEAARTAERGVDQARAGTREAMDQAARQAERTASQAKRGLDQAREGLDDARERLGVDDKVEGAQQNLATGLDEAASSFSALAESGRARADELTAKWAKEPGLEIGDTAIRCGDGPSRVCEIDPKLIATLGAEPSLLAHEASLWPKRGETGEGLQLVRVRTPGFATALGLREGDILLSINGAKLVSFDAIAALDKALSGKPVATLVYERAGQREQLTVIQSKPPE